MQQHTLRRFAPAIALAGTILLSACGSTDPDTTGSGAGAACLAGDTDCVDESNSGAGSSCLVDDPNCVDESNQGMAEGEPAPGMAMCVAGATDCNDTAFGEDAAADCEDAATTCDDTGTGDERMNPSITIVQAFVDPDTRVVETAPGTVADPMRLFLQEAVVDGAMVTVSFNGSDAPCFVVDHVEVVEDGDMVVVTVWAGRPDPSADCSAMTMSTQAVAFDLGADLGSRLLLDGSRMDAPAENV